MEYRFSSDRHRRSAQEMILMKRKEIKHVCSRDRLNVSQHIKRDSCVQHARTPNRQLLQGHWGREDFLLEEKFTFHSSMSVSMFTWTPGSPGVPETTEATWTLKLESAMRIKCPSCQVTQDVWCTLWAFLKMFRRCTISSRYFRFHLVRLLFSCPSVWPRPTVAFTLFKNVAIYGRDHLHMWSEWPSLEPSASRTSVNATSEQGLHVHFYFLFSCFQDLSVLGWLTDKTNNLNFTLSWNKLWLIIFHSRCLYSQITP